MADTNPTNRNRMILLLIGGIPVTIILAATWLWYFVVSGEFDLVGALGTSNRGTLVQPPRQLDEQRLFDDAGFSLKFADLEPRWAMLVPASGGVCDENCERSLYLTRQIHLAMGKEFNRLRRLYVSDQTPDATQLLVSRLSDQRPAPAPDEFARYLATEHDGLTALGIAPADFTRLFPEYSNDTGVWYLVDPAGWVMMSYNDDIPYKDVIADLKFLLKNSGG
jgi:hypothetical protein